MTSKQRILIVGAGGLGRKVFHAFQDCCQAGDFADAELGGFVDDNATALAEFSGYPPVLYGVQDYAPGPEDLLLCAIGIPAPRKKVVEILKQRGARFATLVHPTAIVRPTATLGEGVIVAPQAAVCTEVSVGDFALINGPVAIGHDTTIGDFSELCPKAAVSGGCKIEEGVFLATGCSVAPGCRIGAWSKVSMNSTVMRSVPPYSLVHGVPGKVTRDHYRKKEE